MNREAHEWNARKAGRRLRIIGPKPAPAAVPVQPRQHTLAALARSTGQRPQLGSLLAEAATTLRRWQP